MSSATPTTARRPSWRGSGRWRFGHGTCEVGRARRAVPPDGHRGGGPSKARRHHAAGSDRRGRAAHRRGRAGDQRAANLVPRARARARPAPDARRRPRGRGRARMARRPARRHQGPRRCRRRAHDLRFADLQGSRAEDLSSRGRAHRAQGRHRHRQVEHAGIRRRRLDLQRGVRAHLQSLEHGADIRRLDRRRGGSTRRR